MEAVPAQRGRFEVLDGWRGLSILAVLASHMLPLGDSDWELNESAGKVGMALFFCLSGFLIVSQLHKNHNLLAFYTRRMFRILPLAVLVIVGVALAQRAPWQVMLTNLLFLENYVFDALLPDLKHFWSLCLEMHFYVFIGLSMWLTRFRWFGLLFFVWVGLTINRAIVEPTGTIETHLRVDELLAGVNLALLNLGYGPEWLRNMLRRVPLAAWLALLAVCCVKWTLPIHFLRGFAASALVGHTLFRHAASEGAREAFTHRVLSSRPLRYIADISYALYVIHPLTMAGWLGTGTTPLIKYAKRPICFALTFAIAHLSTFHYEEHFIAMGKALAKDKTPARRSLNRIQPMPRARMSSASD